ncbi:MAG TPA: hypothetical protein VFD90_16720 [Gaiellales bacterium]|nr:hypothetical protein [Gaiellales bacterium]
MSYRCPDCGGEVDLARTPLESGLVRLATLGVADFALEFDDPEVQAGARVALGGCPHSGDPVWDAERLQPLAREGLARLEDAAAGDPRLAELLQVWRPRAFGLAGRADELSRDEALRGRLELRLADVERRMRAAAAAGDDDEAERLHARYIELGTTYAGRMAVWRSTPG